MYVDRSGFTYYGSGGEQRHTRAPFLILADDGCHDGVDSPLFACIRKVALTQLGQFMMGRANIGGHWRSLSGAYGGDGLPAFSLDSQPYLARHFLQVPADLARAYWSDEPRAAADLRTWAREHLPY